MELASTQKLLARIYTDSVLRNRFFADPVTIGASFGLAPETARQLADLPKEEVHKFTKSLRRQRLEWVGRELPFSLKLLGRRFGELFKDYVVKSQLPENAQPWVDAIHFYEAIAGRKKHLVEIRKWELEFMRFECTRLAFNNSPDRVRRFFSFRRINRLENALAAGEIPTSATPLPCFTIFWRWTKNHPIDTISL
jgi:hypothetical protein